MYQITSRCPKLVSKQIFWSLAFHRHQKQPLHHRSPLRFWPEAKVYVKKIFGSDSAQISCVKSLGHKDFKFWVSSKSETKKFFFSKGGTLWRFSDFRKKKFLSPILMKFKIWNPYGLGISHMKFEQNRRQKNFWHRRVPPLDFSQNFGKIFLSPILLKFHVWNP